MPWFRPSLRDPLPPRLDEETVGALLADVVAPTHFFAPGGLECEAFVQEDVPWEVFQGRLLPPRHAGRRQSFTAWNVWLRSPDGSRPAAPVLSVKLDVEAGEIHVVRFVLSHVPEARDPDSNVIELCEVERWVAELAGTLDLAGFVSLEALRDELIARLFHAVAGQRLPLSSVETPLPAFTFGELFYCYRRTGGGSAMASWRELAAQPEGLNPSEQAKCLEVLLRALPVTELPNLADGFGRRGAVSWPTLWRTLFNEVSLSPWTDFLERGLVLGRLLEERGEWSAEERVDLLGWLLRQVCRHLTAYDLVIFHHRGANYPDALLLDRVLAEYLEAIAQHPGLFEDRAGDGERRQARLRRRALRQGWLLRRQYEGHPVPDQPTSPGENARVLPASHPRLPEEQLLHPHRRRRKLFEGQPLSLTDTDAFGVLRQSVVDLLNWPVERWELGTALFLDRPFGGGKAPGEPDTTLLLAGVGFSASIARRRWEFLESERLLSGPEARSLAEAEGPRGVPLSEIGGPARAGTVSLDDARRVAEDFVFRFSTRSSLVALGEAFDFPDGVRSLLGAGALVARSPVGPGVRVFDPAGRPVLELEPVLEQGYQRRAGVEVPVGGLRVVGTGEVLPIRSGTDPGT